VTTPLPTTTLARDCPGVAVPAGTPVVLPAGTTVQVVQNPGAGTGTVTVRIPSGGLVRLDRAAADALGIAVPVDERRVTIAGTRFSMEQVTDALRTVYDPEIPIDIVELGLVYRCEEERDQAGRRRIVIDLSMTAPACGMGNVLRADVERVVARIPGVDDVCVTLVWDPPWDFHRLSDAARLQLGLL
jgi:probable FeS assembly SUF system protein SufT